MQEVQCEKWVHTVAGIASTGFKICIMTDIVSGVAVNFCLGEHLQSLLSLPVFSS